MSLTLVFGSLRGDLSVAVVAAVLFVRALGSTLHTPAFNALTPLIAPPEVLGKLAGMLQFMQSGSYIIGNAIAAAVYPAFGLTFMIALDVAGAVLASIAVATSGIKTPAPERHTPEENAEASHRAVRAFLLETANGYRELKRHHGLFGSASPSRSCSRPYPRCSRSWCSTILGAPLRSRLSRRSRSRSA